MFYYTAGGRSVKRDDKGGSDGPFYPYHPTLNPSERRRADWEVRGVFIEYWGLFGDREYDKRMQVKRKLAKETGKVLIEVYPSDLYNLSQKLDCLREDNWS